MIVTKERHGAETDFKRVEVHYAYCPEQIVQLKVPVDTGIGGCETVIDVLARISVIDVKAETATVMPLPMYRWGIFSGGKRIRGGVEFKGRDSELWHYSYFERIPLQFMSPVTYCDSIKVEEAIWLAYYHQFIVYAVHGHDEDTVSRDDTLYLYLLNVDMLPDVSDMVEGYVGVYPYFLAIKKNPEFGKGAGHYADEAILGKLHIAFHDKRQFLFNVFENGMKKASPSPFDKWVPFDDLVYRCMSFDDEYSGPFDCRGMDNFRLLFHEPYVLKDAPI